MRHPICAPIALLLVAAPTACQRSPEPAALAESSPPALSGKAKASDERPSPPGASPERAQTPRHAALLDALGLGGRAIPDGLVLDGDCPAMGSDADAEIAAQLSARVPVKVGLTLSHSWAPTEGEDYECLNQIIAVDREGYVFTVGSRTHVRRT